MFQNSSKDKGYSYYRDQRSLKSRLKRLSKFLLALFLAYSLLTLFLFVPITVRNESMLPAVKKNCSYFVSIINFGGNIPFTSFHLPGLEQPSRGDIILCRPGYYKKPALFIRIIDPVLRFVTFQRFSIESSSKEKWNNCYTVKRIIGLPGDTIRMSDFLVTIKPRDQETFYKEFDLIKTPYQTTAAGLPVLWNSSDPFSGNKEELILKDNEYFVLGDNRTASNDSQYWGPIKRSAIVGKLLFRYWPIHEPSGN